MELKCSSKANVYCLLSLPVAITFLHNRSTEQVTQINEYGIFRTAVAGSKCQSP